MESIEIFNYLIPSYTDLNPNQYQALKSGRISGKTRQSFIQDGMIDENGMITLDGQKALENFEYYFIKGGTFPRPTYDVPLDIRWGKQGELLSVHFKALAALARRPGLGWKHICKIFGQKTIEDLHRFELIEGTMVRGASQHITQKGLEKLKGMVMRRKKNEIFGS